MAEESGRTPGPWELMRMLEKIDDRLESMESRMVSNAVFQAHQVATERRFEGVETVQRDWTAESRGEHARLDAKIVAEAKSVRLEMKAQSEKQDALERAQRESRSRVWLAIGISVLGMLGSLGVGLILRATGGG